MAVKKTTKTLTKIKNTECSDLAPEEGWPVVVNGKNQYAHRMSMNYTKEKYQSFNKIICAVCWEKSKHAKCLLCGCDLSVWFSEPNGLCMPWGFVPLDIEHNGGKLIAGGICNRCCNGKKFNEIYNSVVDYLTKNLVSSGGDIVVKRLHMPCDTVQ